MSTRKIAFAAVLAFLASVVPTLDRLAAADDRQAREILFVDEVLSVGDAAFRKKCMGSGLCMTAALRTLEEVQRGELAFDRTLKINTSGKTDKDELASRLPVLRRARPRRLRLALPHPQLALDRDPDLAAAVAAAL